MSDDAERKRPRWLREPVLHFVLIGLAIFAIDRAMQPEQTAEEIVVTDRAVERMRTDFATRHGKPPDEEQTQALIRAHVRDEVLYREALELGLHRSDPIVRRRMIQAMEFLSEDLVPVPAPTDEQLRAYLEAHPDRFTRPARVSFDHVFFSAGADAEERAEQALDSLRAGADAGQMGDAFAHGATVEYASQPAIAGKFGAEFAESVMQLEEGGWRGPVESKFGWHLVRVESSKPAGQPSLDEARHQIEVAWRQDAREKANKEAVERLLDHYDVRVEWDGAKP